MNTFYSYPKRNGEWNIAEKKVEIKRRIKSRSRKRSGSRSRGAGKTNANGKHINNNSRPKIILDLDNTLINSLDPDEFKKIPSEVKEKFKIIPMDNYYHVFERPYLQDFLTYLFDNFDVSVFTAADKDYAIFICENFIQTKKGRKLDYILYRDHCDISEKIYGSPKKLHLLWDVLGLKEFNPCNTFIIDDLDDVYNNNKGNSIKAHKFEILSEKGRFRPSSVEDKFLVKVKERLEKIRERHQIGKNHKVDCKCRVD